MSSKSKSTQASRQSSKGVSQTTAYLPARQGMNQGLRGLGQWMNSSQAKSTYGGPRVADMSGDTQQGLGQLTNNSGYGTSEAYYNNVLNGDYLNAGNPYMEQVKQSVMDSVMPGINATFARSGMTGATNHAGQLATGLSNGMAGHLFANYENERNRQMSAAGALPNMLRQQANDSLLAGSIRDQHAQNVINADIGAFNERRDRPMAVAQAGLPMLMQAGGMFGRNRNNSTGKSKSTTTSTPSEFSQALGIGMMGLSAISGMPMGMGMGMSGAMGAGAPTYAPMSAASAGMMNSYTPSNNPWASQNYY